MRTRRDLRRQGGDTGDGADKATEARKLRSGILTTGVGDIVEISDDEPIQSDLGAGGEVIVKVRAWHSHRRFVRDEMYLSSHIYNVVACEVIKVMRRPRLIGEIGVAAWLLATGKTTLLAESGGNVICDNGPRRNKIFGCDKQSQFEGS